MEGYYAPWIVSVRLRERFKNYMGMAGAVVTQFGCRAGKVKGFIFGGGGLVFPS